jgi:ribosomal protein S8
MLSKIFSQVDKNFNEMNVISSSYEKNQFPSTSFLNYEEAKSFLPNLILLNPYLNINGLLNLTFNKRLLSLVSNFYGYIPTFSEPYVIRSFPPVLDGKMKEASFWHKDSNDEKNFLQLFLYLNNIDKYGGPFKYLKNSHKNNLKSYLPLYDLEKNYIENFGRVSDVEIKKFYSEEDILELQGDAGTLIIADTSGFHRGPFWDLNNLQFLKERTLINISVTSGSRYLRNNQKNKISPKILEEDFLKLDSVQKDFFYNSYI